MVRDGGNDADRSMIMNDDDAPIALGDDAAGPKDEIMQLDADFRQVRDNHNIDDAAGVGFEDALNTDAQAAALFNYFNYDDGNDYDGGAGFGGDGDRLLDFGRGDHQPGQEEQCLIDFKGFDFEEELGGGDGGDLERQYGATTATAIERARKKAEKLSRGFEKLMLGTDRNTNGKKQQSEQMKAMQAKKT